MRAAAGMLSYFVPLQAIGTSMIKSVVFDLGGVVVGRDYGANGHRMRRFEFLQGDRPFPEFWKRFDRGEATLQEVAEGIAAAGGCSVEEAHGEVERIMSMFDEFPRTVELIEELSARGYGLYVLSNMPQEFYEYMNRKFGVFRYFDGVVISSREKLSKPDPRFFNILCERYGLIPEETLFVDDKASNTDAAAKLGFRVCRFEPETGPDEVRRQLEMDNFAY